MTTFVLDTDMMSLLQRGHPGVAAHFDHHQSYEVATTIISVEEQLSGWYALLRRAKTPMDLVRIYGYMSETVRFLGTLPILTFTDEAAGIYERLRNRHSRIGRNGSSHRCRRHCSRGDAGHAKSCGLQGDRGPRSRGLEP